ncbi:Transposon TX1 uncharacterized 149 kDa protein [Linum perenne]
MNAALIVPVSPLEIREAVFDIGAHQAPGPDGFSACFYHEFWDLVAPDLIAAVIDFFESIDILPALNHTWIALLPKVVEVKTMKEIRPIGLCNVPYKVISKILTKRLGRILPTIISPTQNGFVQGRAIADNMLIAHEIMHFMAGRTSGKTKYMALKLDMEKAYDRIEWPFLFTTMRMMGFGELWISWIRKCVTSASFAVLFNGQKHGYFHSSRGLRQGDPLSPLLFAICSEGLITLLNQAQSTNALAGMRLNAYSPILTHLMFADDTYLFLRASLEDIDSLLQILACYQEVSGQKVNLSKSAVSFCKVTPLHDQTDFCRALGVRASTVEDEYLGLPTTMKRSKVETFKYVEEMVLSKLQAWRGKFLSPAGMEILVKSVLSALPVYTMTCFLLPKKNIKRLTTLIRDFWWGQHDGRRKIKWVLWSRLCTPKSKGGLGFRDLHHFNLALLARQGLKIITEPDSLLAQVYKGKYFHDSTFLLAERRSNPSWGWSSIIASRDLLVQGLRCQVGTGLQILAFQDNWIPTVPPRPPERTFTNEPWSPYTHVAMFINHGSWDIQLLTRVFSSIDVDRISFIPLPIETIPDQFVWQFSDSGAYTVHSGYDIIHYGLVDIPEFGPTSPMDADARNGIWTFPIPPKLQFFIWKCVLGVLPTRTALNVRIPDFPRSCPVCEVSEESVCHLLLFCPLAARFGSIMNIPFPLVSSINFCIVWRRFFDCLRLLVGKLFFSGGDCGNPEILLFSSTNNF